MRAANAATAAETEGRAEAERVRAFLAALGEGDAALPLTDRVRLWETLRRLDQTRCLVGHGAKLFVGAERLALMDEGVGA